MLRRISQTGLLLTVLLTGSGCMHNFAYMPDHGLDQDPGPMAGTRSSLKWIGESTFIVITGRLDGASATESRSARGFYLGVGTFLLADLPGTFAMDAVRAPYDTTRLLRSTWNDE